jgi:hypothetical protein
MLVVNAVMECNGDHPRDSFSDPIDLAPLQGAEPAGGYPGLKPRAE